MQTVWVPIRRESIIKEFLAGVNPEINAGEGGIDDYYKDPPMWFKEMSCYFSEVTKRRMLPCWI